MGDGAAKRWTMARRPALRLLAGAMLAACRPGAAAPPPPTPTPSGDGLLGRYYATRDWSGPVELERIDPVIQFDWSDEHPIASQVFSVRWEGFLVIPPGEGGLYTLYLQSDDASWLYLDGTLVVDNGGIHTAQTRAGVADLAPGAHQIRIDYAELAPRLSVMSLQWRKPNGERGTVPNSALFSRQPATR
jgi:hypothetical protein